MRQRNFVLRRNESGIGCGQRVVAEVVLFDPGQTVPAQSWVLVADKRFRSSVAGLGGEHGAHAGRQIGHTGGSFGEVSKHFGKSGAGSNLHHDLRQIQTRQSRRDSCAQLDE
jgi:hypothetical protein